MTFEVSYYMVTNHRNGTVIKREIVKGVQHYHTNGAVVTFNDCHSKLLFMVSNDALLTAVRVDEDAQ
jgi:hypothetical protein